MHHSADDESLSKQAALGDEAAFTALFERYYPCIHAYAYRICLDTSLAEDVAQEVFVKTARALRDQKHRTHFRAWIYRIAKNTAIDHLRRRKRESEHLEFHSELPNTSQPTVSHTSVSHENLPLGIASLSPDQRAVIALVYYENLTHAQAAKQLGCAETTVSWRLFRARQKLKKILDQIHAL